MAQFTIEPRNLALAPMPLAAKDARDVINILQRYAFREVDVLSDGAYAYSMRCEKSGCWVVFHRHSAALARSDRKSR